MYIVNSRFVYATYLLLLISLYFSTIWNSPYFYTVFQKNEAP